MISRDSFVKIMDGLRDYWDELGKDMDRLGVVFDDNHLTRVFNNTLDALCEDIKDGFEISSDMSWCYYFVFELDWGREEMAENCVDINGVKYSLKTAEELYDFLMMLKEG